MDNSCWVIFLIQANGIHPEELIGMLGSGSSFRKTKSGSVWSWEKEYSLDEGGVAGILNSVLDNFESQKEYLKNLASNGAALNIQWLNKLPYAGMSLNAQLINRLSSFGVGVNFHEPKNS